MTKPEIKKHIKEYAGTKFYFLVDYVGKVKLESEFDEYDKYEFDEYVEENIVEITTKVIYGKRWEKPEYRNTINTKQLIDKVRKECYNTLTYIEKQKELKGENN